MSEITTQTLQTFKTSGNVQSRIDATVTALAKMLSTISKSGGEISGMDKLSPEAFLRALILVVETVQKGKSGFIDSTVSDIIMLCIMTAIQGGSSKSVSPVTYKVSVTAGAPIDVTVSLKKDAIVSRVGKDTIDEDTVTVRRIMRMGSYFLKAMGSNLDWKVFPVPFYRRMGYTASNFWLLFEYVVEDKAEAIQFLSALWMSLAAQSAKKMMDKVSGEDIRESLLKRACLVVIKVLKEKGIAMPTVTQLIHDTQASAKIYRMSMTASKVVRT
jgi:hypothetical protein